MWHPESIFDASGHLDEGVVHAWLDGQLAPDAATQVEQHAAGCAACSAMVAEARGLIAGASRVLSSLDEPAVGHAPSRGMPIGIVASAAASARHGAGSPAAAGAASAPRKGRGWTTRRISFAAAAALVFVTGTLLLRDGGSVREMVQADQLALDSTVGFAQSDRSNESGGAAAPSGESAALSAANQAADAANTQEAGSAERAAEAPVPGVSAPRGIVGSTIGASALPRGEFGSAEAPVISSPPAPVPASAAAPAPPPSPAAPPAAGVAGGIAKGVTRSDAGRVGLADAPVVTGMAVAPPAGAAAREMATRDASDSSRDATARAATAPAAAARAATASAAKARAITAQTADERRQLQASRTQGGVTFSAESATGRVRSSGEIQAMVRMVSSCWRIAGSDSVLELLPPGSSRALFAAPDASELWIPGWLRIGRDATNPDRIWWLPLGDSVSVRVRGSSETGPDLVITPRADGALLRRVPRADSLAGAGPDSSGAVPESATSVRCPSP